MVGKGHNPDSAKKICGLLESQSQPHSNEKDEAVRYSSSSLDDVLDSIKNALTTEECEKEARDYGQDDQDAIDRICKAIVDEETPEEEQQEEEDDEEEEKEEGAQDNVMDDQEEEDEENKKKNPAYFSAQSAHPKVLAQCVKMKMENDDSLSKEDASKECEKAFRNSALEQQIMVMNAALQQQNQHTDPGKLQEYNNDIDKAIDWYSDAEADYNEKSKNRIIDLSYYDDDINKCVDEQVKNGLSQEDARKFCNSLADVEGAGGIRQPGENVEYTPEDNNREASSSYSYEDLQSYFAKTYYQDKSPGNPSADMPDVNALHSEDEPEEYDNPIEEDLEKLFHDIDEESLQVDSAATNNNNKDDEEEDDEEEGKDAEDKEEEEDEDDDREARALDAWFSHNNEDDGGINNNDRTGLVSQQPLQSDDTAQRRLGRDTTNGGRHQDTGKYVTGHGENDLKNPHTHDLGSNGPDYTGSQTQAGNQPDQATTVSPEIYQVPNTNMNTNSHIDRHMDSTQKQVYNDHMQPQIATEQDDEQMKGLGRDSTKEEEDKKQFENQGLPYTRVKPEIGPGPIGGNVVKEQDFGKPGIVRNASTQQVEYDIPDPVVSEKEQLYRSAKSGDEDSQSIIDYIDRHYAGSYDNYVNDMQLKPFEQNNKLFVKAFLMDSSINQNKWGVDGGSLERNIRTYVGKPLVLQENFDHPIARPGNDLDLQLEYQELYRVGNILDVVKKGTRYDAIAEVTDDFAKKAFREGDLPLYVSPQLFKLDAKEPDGKMAKWTGTHLAIVKEPAYTVKKATLNGECTGDLNTCVSYLKKASVHDKFGYGSCGFCNYKVLTSAKASASGTAPQPKTMQASASASNSDNNNNASNQTILTVPPISQPAASSSLLSSLTDTMRSDSVNLTDSNRTNVGELQAKDNEISKLKGLLFTAKKSIEALKKKNEDEEDKNAKLSSRVAAIEMERRKERISSILQGAYNEEEQTAMVDSFSKSGLPVEEIQKIVAPIIASNKQAAEQAEQVKQQEEVDKQAQELAKSASKLQTQTNTQQSKVALKNANTESLPAESRVPALFKARGHLFNDGGVT